MFRAIKSVLFGLLVCIAFTSCEKEVSEESGLLPGMGSGGGGTSSGTAVFALDGAPNTCNNHLVGGTYIAGTSLISTNAVAIYADVTAVGTYTISTATINGITFSGSGTFASTGLQQVLLDGAGTPTAAGTFNYKPGSASCSFPITVTTMPAGPVAEGTLNCTGATFAGTYTQSVALTGANTVSIPVNVTTAGSYSVNIAATNGVTFSGAGNLALGAQSITLAASGTPTNAGAISFAVSLGASNCSFSITFLPAPPPAVGTLDCAGISTAGVYTQGTALTSSNTFSIPVNVTTAGLYSITATANGVTFSGSGVVGAGAQTIVLTGTGTPAASGDFSFNVALGTSTCSYSITFLVGSTDFLKCSIDGSAIINFSTLSGTLIPGTFDVSGDSGGQSLQIGVTDAGGGNIGTGTYHNLSVSNMTVFCDDQLTIGGTTWFDIDATASANIFTVNITAITATTVTGTFSGKLTDLASGSTKMITNGSFNITY